MSEVLQDVFIVYLVMSMVALTLFIATIFIELFPYLVNMFKYFKIKLSRKEGKAGIEMQEEEMFINTEEEEEFNSRIARLKQELIENNFPLDDSKPIYNQGTHGEVSEEGLYNIPHDEVKIHYGEEDGVEFSK